ncbi:hypothetical protein P3T76_013387 [Phytophthora citrophthora]|uniref:Uncharacterized protein n=1 Tax=Phytophthora citrophthora TaxID=4793 RepID=A0AAD9G4B6_9STRA|nr:hypothetical protein P3T76_013387 [Phytophthora citrophthora]
MEKLCQRGVAADPSRIRHIGPFEHLYIVNEDVFELVLSFLSNQTLTKLHSITGDFYPNCEPDLAPFCCACDNDNPKVFNGVCRHCQSKMDGYTLFVEKEVATTVYGLKIRDLAVVPAYPYNGHQDAILYHRVDLENYLITKFGSKLGWLRDIARRNEVERTIEGMQQQDQEERKVFVESLAPGFAVYAVLINMQETNKSLLWQSSQRFTALLTALKSRGLQLRPGSKLCEQFIVGGNGDIASIVDTMEEMRFLNGCTDYTRRCQRKIESTQDEVKMELCISYLDNPKGFKLPRKWENCRSRFEEVQRTGGVPQRELRYIYSD